MFQKWKLRFNFKLNDILQHSYFVTLRRLIELCNKMFEQWTTLNDVSIVHRLRMLSMCSIMHWLFWHNVNWTITFYPVCHQYYLNWTFKRENILEESNITILLEYLSNKKSHFYVHSTTEKLLSRPKMIHFEVNLLKRDFLNEA